MFAREKEVLAAYLARRKMRLGRSRLAVLEAFLSSEGHVTAAELHRLVRQRHPSCGFASVYRTLKVLCACGLGRELRLEDGGARFEHSYHHPHHDHLCCVACGRLIGFYDARLERLKARVCRLHGFLPQRHRLEFYGLCPACRRKGCGHA